MDLEPPARRAKVVCTLGPATRSAEGIESLVRAGMDVARLNLSHGTWDDHRRAYGWVREATGRTGRAVAVLADLQGPKIRLGEFRGGSALLEAGAEFEITAEPVEGDARRASTTYAPLAHDVRPGSMLLLDDGRLRLEALATDGVTVRTRVIEGGLISDHKGINLPGTHVSAPALTEKDLEDLAFALGLQVDLVALSFVRDPADAERARAAMDAVGVRVPLIAKIEKPEAVDRLEAIVDAFDGLMVARGDLGVEMPLEQVPLVQKRAIQMARECAKPVIVATQMLESMIDRPGPTRAEISDVANAVLDGADALMLSGETSVGKYPAATVRTMVRTIVATESAMDRIPPLGQPITTLAPAIAHAAVEIARELGARALVAFTQAGTSARWLARHRSPVSLLAFTTEPAIRSQLAVAWGVETFVMPPVHDTDQMVEQVERAMLDLGRCRPGDDVVIVAGTPPGHPGSTNTLRVHRLGS